jgi:putative ABC transport system permease protein
MLACAGAIGGLILGGMALPVVLALDPQTTRVLGIVNVDWRVQAAVAAVTMVVTLLSGVLPVVRETRSNVVEGIAAGSRRTVSSRQDGRIRRGLVAAEAALAVVLLASGGLLLSAFARSTEIDPGFDPRHVLTAQVRLSPTAYPNAAARNAFVARMLERVAAARGVVNAATTTNPFVPGSAFQTLLHIEGQPRPDGQPHTVHYRRVSAGYFQTLRIPMVAGRDFDNADGADAPLVAIISRALAEKYWPDQDPIGRRVIRSGAAISVIGVVEEVSDVGLGQTPEPTFYVPYMQNNPVTASISLVVRTVGDPLDAVDEVRAAIASIDPAQPIDNVVTLEQFLHDSLGPQRFRSTLLLLLAALGCALAAIGVYGVTARTVHERRREVAVRLALGASPSRVWRLVAAGALRAVAIGAAVGFALAAAANTTLIRVLPGLDRAEPWVAVPAIAILVVAAVFAAAIPARRVVRVNPSVALNQ